MVLKAKQDGLPLPGAIAPGTPMSDVTKVGDTFVTNAMLDNVLVSPDGFCDAGTKVYANGHDLKDPLLSPMYGDMKGFPPTNSHEWNARSPAKQHRARSIASCDRQASTRYCRYMKASLTRSITVTIPHLRLRKRLKRSPGFSTSTSGNSSYLQ